MGKPRGEVMEGRATGARHRLLVGLMAIGGEIGFQLALILPVAFVLLFGALWFNHVWMWWVASGAVIVIWWLLQPSTSLPGRAISRQQAPALHALVDELALSAQSLAMHEIRIDESFNAGALELGRGWLPGRLRRVLILGAPMLAALSTPALRAVVAHELGHFSKRHGRLGHWIYRARLSWRHAAEADSEDSALERAAATFARWFAGAFETRALLHARRCEYEADRVAADVVGEQTFAQALVEFRWLAVRHADAGLGELALASADIPRDVWRRAGALWRAHPLEPGVLDRMWEMPSRAGDSHPSLGERASALGQALPQLMAAVSSMREGPSPAGVEALAALDPPLAPDVELDWAISHHVHRAVGPVTPPRDEDQRLFERETARLFAGEASEPSALLDLLKRRPHWAPTVRQVLADAPAGVLNETEQRRNAVLLARALRRRERALEHALQQLDAGDIGPDAADDALAPVVAAWRRAHRSVQAIGVGRLPAVDEQERPVPAFLLVVRLDPTALEGVGEDTVSEACRRQLAAWLGPGVAVLVQVIYTTEPAPAWFRPVA